MPELRWILLVLGVLFIGALAWWELRRSRQARRGSEIEHHAPATAEPEIRAPRVHREPTISLPEIRREPTQDPPIIEVPEDDSLIGLRIDGQRIEDAPAAKEAEPESIVPMPAPPSSSEEPVRPVPLDIEPPPQELIIDWPPAEQRELLTLRLVAPPERYSGRVVRQALTAEGFLHGKYEIFHKPAADGRVIMSAASLTKPGTFDLETMDIQRFGGLNLFAVLPGPLSPESTFDEMITVARALQARLHGTLQDERGAPLTAASIAQIRENLRTAGEANKEPLA